MDAADGSPACTIAVVVVIDEQHEMIVCNLVILIDDAVIDTLLVHW